MHESTSPFPDWAWELFRCPHTRSPLRRADASLVARLEDLQREDRLRDLDGIPVHACLADGLVSACGTYFYLVIDGVPNFIAGEAIPIPPP